MSHTFSDYSGYYSDYYGHSNHYSEYYPATPEESETRSEESEGDGAEDDEELREERKPTPADDEVRKCKAELGEARKRKDELDSARRELESKRRELENERRALEESEAELVQRLTEAEWQAAAENAMSIEEWQAEWRRRNRGRRLRQLPPNALEEQWHSFNSTARTNEKKPATLLTLVQRSENKGDQCGAVRRLVFFGVNVKSINVAFPALAALELDPGPDHPGSPWSFRIKPIGECLGLQHLNLHLECFQDEANEIAPALAPLVNLRRLRLSGLRNGEFDQLTVVKGMKRIEAFEIDYTGGEIMIDDVDWSDEDGELPIIDYSGLVHLRLLHLRLPGTRLCRAECKPEHRDGFPFKPPPHLRDFVVNDVSIAKPPYSLNSYVRGDGYTESLRWHLKFKAGVNVRSVRIDERVRGSWFHPDYARMARAGAWWSARACERLVGATLPALCEHLVREQCRAAPDLVVDATTPSTVPAPASAPAHGTTQ